MLWGLTCFFCLIGGCVAYCGKWNRGDVGREIVDTVVTLVVIVPLVVLKKCTFCVKLSVVKVVKFCRVVEYEDGCGGIPGVVGTFTVVYFMLLVLSALVGFDTRGLFVVYIVVVLIPLVFVASEGGCYIRSTFCCVKIVLFLKLTFGCVVGVESLSLGCFVCIVLVAVSASAFTRFCKAGVKGGGLYPGISPGGAVRNVLNNAFLNACVKAVFLLVIDSDFSVVVTVVMSLMLSLYTRTKSLMFSTVGEGCKIGSCNGVVPKRNKMLSELSDVVFTVCTFAFVLCFM